MTVFEKVNDNWLNFCENLLYWILSKADNNSKYGQNSIYAFKGSAVLTVPTVAVSTGTIRPYTETRCSAPKVPESVKFRVGTHLLPYVKYDVTQSICTKPRLLGDALSGTATSNFWKIKQNCLADSRRQKDGQLSMVSKPIYFNIAKRA